MKKSGMRRPILWGNAAVAGAASMPMLFAGLMISGLFVHENGVLYRKRLALFLLAMLVCMAVAAFVPSKIKRWKGGRCLYALVGIAAGGFTFQYITCAEGLNILTPAYIPLMLSLSAVLFAIVWLAVGDVCRAVNCFYWLMYLCGYAYECIYLFRGVAFKPMDILSFQTALSVAGGYNYPFGLKHLWWYMGGVLLWSLSCWVSKDKMNFRVGMLVKAVCVLLAAGWISLLVSSNVLSAWNVTTTAFEQDAPLQNRTQGTLATLVKECQQLNLIRPAGYDSTNLVKNDERLMSPELHARSESRPNVLVVINESFADLQSIWQIETDCDPLRYLHSLDQNVVRGNLFVSAYGGSTCNTEHSFLTATIPAPKLNMPLLSTVKQDTPALPWAFRSSGYRTIALHPHTARNYQRDEIYPRLGFDVFYSKPHFAGSETVRGLTSDRACYDKVISLFEEKAPEERLFVYTLTLQNHSDYINIDVEQTVQLADGSANEALTNYLNLIAVSDRALEHLITYFEAQTEPVVILFFGDHQPRLDLSMYALQENLSDVQQQLAQFTTPFFIWANYPIETGIVDAISVNYLAPLLLQVAGLPINGYDEWLLETAQTYPVAVLSGYADQNGLFTPWLGDEDPQRLNMLDQLRYNRLYDPENRLPALSLLP